jgi:acyl-coenzyme A synthetase/AMP-(fatty) acid ligase
MGSAGTRPDYGRRLLPVVIDEIALNDPGRAWTSLPYDDNDLSRGYEDISYLVFANAINKLAWHIESCAGPSKNNETFVYIGRPDVRYQIIAMAAAKTRYKVCHAVQCQYRSVTDTKFQVLFSSHMHSAESHIALMKRTETKYLFSASGVETADILAGLPIPQFTVPELADLLDATPTKIYPFSMTYDEAAPVDYLILHSSGSTGAPKPININHASIGTMDARHLLEHIDPVSGQKRRWLERPGKTRCLVPFLPYHGICALMLMVATILDEGIWIPGFRNKASSKTDIPHIITHSKPDRAFFSPAIIEDLVSMPDAATYFKKLQYLYYGGGKCFPTTTTASTQNSLATQATSSLTQPQHP